MSYKVELLNNKPIYVATMKTTIPEFSTAVTKRAVRTLEIELNRKGIHLTKPNYNFVVAYHDDSKIEVIDVEIVVAVDKLGQDTELIKFIELPEDQQIIRVTANVFEDVHIGLAEWMHDNDFEADGILRTVIHDGDAFIYDCPIKPSED